jgi:c-di-AMP phosphodiesterase-like protein
MLSDMEFLDAANRAGFDVTRMGTARLRKFADLIQSATANDIDDMFMDAVQNDLENGVKWLNENASREFNKNYPEISKFAETIRTKYLTNPKGE